jgi:S-adenosylmethionine synthetase
VDLQTLVRETIARIGYNDATFGFDSHTCGVINMIGKQSPDIAQGVDTGGAGDQGMMFGYATDETEELMPLPIMLAHKLTQRLAQLRKDGTLPWLRPDGKSQVSVRYVDNQPVCVETVVISTQHADTISTEELRQAITEQVILPVIPSRCAAPTLRCTSTPPAASW